MTDPRLIETVRRGRPLSDRFLGWRLDVSEWLPSDYADQCIALSQERGQRRILTGDSLTSRGADFDDDGIHHVFVVDGLDAMNELPWLAKLYRDRFLHLANRVAAGGETTSGPDGIRATYTCSLDPRSALNINRLPPGEMYEWHVDSNPLTGLLFCLSDDFDGGELVLRSAPDAPGDAWEVRVRPEPGVLLLFDARAVPHCVRPCSVDRVTVPMNYYLSSEPPTRPSDLDAYLYD